MTALKFVLLERGPWRPGGVAAALASRGHVVARIAPARPAWLPAKSGDGPVGRWREERLFSLEPRSWLPVLRTWPFDGGASWKGSERFTVPRAGVLLREAGFANADAVVVRDFGLPHLIRHLQPKCLVVVLEEDPAENAALPRIVRRRAHETIADADVVLALSRGARSAAQRASAAKVVGSEDAGDAALADAIIRAVRA